MCFSLMQKEGLLCKLSYLKVFFENLQLGLAR